MQAVWHAVDKDGSGLLDQSELAAVFVQVCDSSACSNNCCSPCDSDLIRNEQISRTQHAVCLQMGQNLSEAQVAKTFKKLDKVYRMHGGP